jgi:septum formation protein
VDKLYLGSQSAARHELLRHAQIPFEIVTISVVEEEAEVAGDVYARVKALSEYKHSGVDHAAILARHEGSSPAFFLTADTLISGVLDGVVYGKPKDHADAKKMLASIGSQEIIIATGMTLAVWHNDGGQWLERVRDTWTASAIAQFSVPSSDVDEYLAACPGALYACGASVIEAHGIRYFKTLSGSYSGALGLDVAGLYERMNAYACASGC